MKSIRPARVNHINVVVEDFDAATRHFHELFGAEFLLDIPQPEWHACLIAFGRVIFELFVPPAFLLHARYGPHYLGIEYQADMPEVREAVAAHGIRIARDIGVALHTHPADCYGISFQFYGGSFHDNDWPLLNGAKMKSAAFWRDDHPLGLTGLKGYTIAVNDIDAASAFLQSFLGAAILDVTERPEAAAKAVVLQVADAEIELLEPLGNGVIQHQLDHCGPGIRSTLFGVRNLAEARLYFADRGIALEPGYRPEVAMVPAERNLGLIFEFME